MRYIFGTREKTGIPVQGEGVPSFIVMCSGKSEKTRASVEGGGLHSFIGVCSNLDGVKKREFR